MPRITPAMIDSNGNPGIGGKVIGVETELVVEVVAGVVEGVLIAVVVSTDVLTPTVVDELEVELLVLEDVAVLLSC
jgi:hypothetical protein